MKQYLLDTLGIVLFAALFFLMLNDGLLTMILWGLNFMLSIIALILKVKANKKQRTNLTNKK